MLFEWFPISHENMKEKMGSAELLQNDDNLLSRCPTDLQSSLNVPVYNTKQF